jgi:hypothetical protein
VAALVVVFAASCEAPIAGEPDGSTSSDTPPPASWTAGATPSARSTPTEQATPHGAPFPVVQLSPESLARVLVQVPVYRLVSANGLVPPEEPSIGTVAAGEEVFVLEGPRDIGGATWYVVLLDPGNRSTTVWMPVSSPEDVEAVEPACPVDVQAALEMPDWDRMVCLSGRPVTLVAEVSHCQGGVVAVQPEWLGYACWTAEKGGSRLGLHARPSSGIRFPDEVVRARITGHFDDPAALRCRYRYQADPPWPWAEPSEAEQVLLCREAFVVDGFEVLEIIDDTPLS